MTVPEPRIIDPEVLKLAALSGTLAAEYLGDEPDPWLGSPFAWIRKTSSSRQRGAIGEKLVAGWFAMNEFYVVRSSSSDADRVVHGYRVEIKLSTPWSGSTFRFQQIRDQNYDLMLCLGLEPFDARAWLIPKAVLLDQPEGVRPQHASGVETSWLAFQTSSPPDWMNSYGGRLSQVARLLHGMGRGSHG